MRSACTVRRCFGRVFEISHVLFCIIPKKGCMNKPSIFFDVEGIASTFARADDKVVFAQLEVGSGFLQHGGCKAQDGLWIGGKGVERFVADESDKDSFFIDDHCATATKSSDKRNGGRQFVEMNKFMIFVRDTEYDGRRCFCIEHDVVA